MLTTTFSKDNRYQRQSATASYKEDTEMTAGLLCREELDQLRTRQHSWATHTKNISHGLNEFNKVSH